MRLKYPERVLPMKVNDTSKWCLALVIAVLLFYWKLFFPSQFTLLDGVEEVRQGYSWLHFWMRSIRAGSLPIWDPYALAGYSFPGEMQTGAFYPLYLLLLLLPLNPDGLLSSMQYNCVILSAHVLAALFMFALGRELKLSHFASFISAFCFSVGSFTGRVTWPHMLGSSIWLPLIFLYLLLSPAGTECSRDKASRKLLAVEWLLSRRFSISRRASHRNRAGHRGGDSRRILCDFGPCCRK